MTSGLSPAARRSTRPRAMSFGPCGPGQPCERSRNRSSATTGERPCQPTLVRRELGMTDTPQPFDLERIESIASRLELREPNKEALESIVFASSRHYDIDREPPPFEAVA